MLNWGVCGIVKCFELLFSVNWRRRLVYLGQFSSSWLGFRFLVDLGGVSLGRWCFVGLPRVRGFAVRALSAFVSLDPIFKGSKFGGLSGIEGRSVLLSVR